MNSSSNLLVLGVTGQVGKLVAKTFEKEQDKLFGRITKERESERACRSVGASRSIDLDDPRTFDQALKDVTGMFLITGYTVDMLVQSKS